MAREEGDGHPIFFGIVALLGVGLAIGAILGGAALVGSRAAGLDGGPVAVENSSTQSLYLPTPSPTQSASGPLVTLSTSDAPTQPTNGFTASPSGTTISLTLTTSTFRPGDKIDLQGTYPAGEGVVLQVQRLEAGDDWEQFSDVDATVVDGTFHTYILTSRTGPAQFRVYDAAADRASNVVDIDVE